MVNKFAYWCMHLCAGLQVKVTTPPTLLLLLLLLWLSSLRIQYDAFYADAQEFVALGCFKHLFSWTMSHYKCNNTCVIVHILKAALHKMKGSFPLTLCSPHFWPFIYNMSLTLYLFMWILCNKFLKKE